VVARFRFLLLLCLGYISFLQAGQTGAATYTIQTVAGSDLVGDGGSALAAFFSQTEGIAVDGHGNVYVADAANNRVREIASDGTISTVAGTGISGLAGDGGPAIAANLNQPYGLALDAVGNLYIADLGNARVRKITADGNIQTVAGGGSLPASGAALGGSALEAQFTAPRNVTLDPDGTLYISDFGANIVYRVSPAGILAVLAGTGSPGYTGDSGASVLAQLTAPAGLASDSNGSVYIADSGNNCIRKVFQGVIATVFSVAVPTGVAVSSGMVYVAAVSYLGTLANPIGAVASALDVAVDSSGNVYATTGPFAIEITLAGNVSTIGGNGLGFYFSGDGGPASSARLHAPAGITLDRVGNIYIADTANNRIRQIAASGAINTIAGTGTAGATGDGGPATQANLNAPESIAIDSSGNLYIADTGNNEIREISPAGNISTVLTGLNNPEYVAVDSAGSLYVADTGNNRVLKATPSGSASVLAEALQPAAVMVDGSGNVWLSEATRISMVTAAGAFSTLADGLQAPRGLALTSNGELLIAETGTNLIRSWTSTAGLTTVAGTGAQGYSGDGGPATVAELNAASDLAVDSKGVVWVADTGNNCIRTLLAATPAAPAQLTTAATVVNAASLMTGAIAPGEIITIFGSGFNPTQTQLLFDGKPATTFFVGATQINALAPASLSANSTTQISIIVAGNALAVFPSSVVGATPAIFTVSGGIGQAAAINQNGSLNSASNPIARGSVVVLYATGQGVNPSEVSLTIGGYTANLLYAGAAPGFEGLMQINAQVPGGFLVPGILPVVLSIGTATSQNGVTIAVE
jgi:uncharacterized protein (TIGR03437 family)